MLIVAGGADPTTELVVEAAHELGIDVDLIDLRSHRLSVRVGDEDRAVLNGDRALNPLVVFNTTSVNGLGLAGADALVRQRSRRWRYRHTAAREEQGVLLAAFAQWRESGVVLVNSPEAHDLSLMPNAVVDRLDRAGVPVNRKLIEGTRTEILLAAGRVVAHLGPVPTTGQVEIARQTAIAAGFELGSVEIFTRPSGIEVVAGWTHQPELWRWPDQDECSRAILRSFPELEPGGPASHERVFFVPELNDP